LVLATTLFNIYINNLCNINNNILLYAHDIVLVLSNYDSMQLVIEANDQLNKIHNWLYNKGLKINMENISINVNNIKLTNTLKLQWIINLIGRLNLKKVSKNTILCTFNLQA
jgi:hypothetical protein